MSTLTARTVGSGPSVVTSRERVASWLMWLATLGAISASVSALYTVLAASGSTKVVETWRFYGLVVFASLFALLSLRPHHYRGVWELVILNKFALSVTAIGYAVHGGIAETAAVIGYDGGLTVLLVAAYICARGWAADAVPVAPARPADRQHR
ncbi:MAG: hypothetical protein ACRDWT_12465 [Jatrophihabitantaceae bacterium]